MQVTTGELKALTTFGLRQLDTQIKLGTKPEDPDMPLTVVSHDFGSFRWIVNHPYVQIGGTIAYAEKHNKSNIIVTTDRRMIWLNPVEGHPEVAWDDIRVGVDYKIVPVELR